MRATAAGSTVGTEAGSGSLMSRFRRKGVSRGETPRDASARAQGHELLGAERIARGHLPGLGEESEGVAISGQAVKIGAMRGSERLELVERPGRRKRFGVQLDAGVRRENAGAAAGGFLRRAGVRRAVGAE